MGFWAEIKKTFLDIVSDDVSPCVCPHCAKYYSDRRTNDNPKIVCDDCKSANSISWVGNLPVCRVCGGHSYTRYCTRCGKSMDGR